MESFAEERGLNIFNNYIEKESGSRLDRPELFMLLKYCRHNDILLIEDKYLISLLTCKYLNS
ncbi:recombinase family protein [Escherichia coli]